MAYVAAIWDKHLHQASHALTAMDKTLRNAHSTGASGQEKEMQRRAQAWKHCAIPHLRRLAQMAYEAPEPDRALARVEALRHWGGVSPRQVFPAHGDDRPILLHADNGGAHEG
jgi:hypothetical protein